MLQFHDLNRRALASLAAEGDFPRPWRAMNELEAAADDAVARLRARRAELAGRALTPTRLRHALDRLVWTDTPEYLDRADVSAARKQRIVQALHRMNQGLFSYHRFLHHLRPAIERVARRERRPARVLELAAGSGEFTMALARLAQRKGLPVEVMGSDIEASYIDLGNARASARGLPVSFKRLNAFDMSAVLPGDHDIYFIAQSIHHFTPGHLAMMIAQAGLAGGKHFVGIDGRRGLLMLAGLPSLTALSLNPDYVHDATITARRFYSEPELEMVARLAAPEAQAVRVHPAEPGFSIIDINY